MTGLFPGRGRLPDRWRWDPTRPLEAEAALTQHCPSWCGDTPGHPYTHRGPGGSLSVREHLRWLGNDVVIAAAYEAVTHDGPEVLCAPAGVRVHLEPDEALDGAQARSLAASLWAAADDLDTIRRSPGGGPV